MDRTNIDLVNRWNDHLRKQNESLHNAFRNLFAVYCSQADQIVELESKKDTLMNNNLYLGKVDHMLTREELVQWLTEAYMAGFESGSSRLYESEAKEVAMYWVMEQLENKE